MHKDYHPATSEAIPLSGMTDFMQLGVDLCPCGPTVRRRAIGTANSPMQISPHLRKDLPRTKYLTGQLSTKRMEWARSIVRIHGLSPPQAAALKEVAYRDGRGQGCSASMNTIAQDTGYNEKSMRRAIKELERAKIIIAQASAGMPKTLRLPVKNGQLTFPVPDSPSGVPSPERPQTSVRKSGVEDHRGQGVQSAPDCLSGVAFSEQPEAPDKETGVGPNPGQKGRGTPDGEAGITEREQNLEKGGNEECKYLFSF